MDSYVLAETFKYLFLLFSEREDLIVDIDNYIFTTEAHLLPLSLSTFSLTPNMANITYAEVRFLNIYGSGSLDSKTETWALWYTGAQSSVF